ncbi:MAG: decaprenyl-phosphate phosphoribosyltransferase [Pseudomonadota bacterium]
MIKSYINLLRPSHYIKNLILFAPLIFSKHFYNLEDTFKIFLGFCLFSMASSIVYVLNDILDYNKDKVHPIKKSRPIACGEISVRSAIILDISLLVLLCTFCAFLGSLSFSIILAIYITTNVFYSSYLKQLVIIDVMFLASFYVIRIVAGAFLINVDVSNWIVLCTFLGALFLGFSKRRHELTTLKGVAYEHRKVLVHYSPYFLDQLIAVVTASTVLSYALYTVSEHTLKTLGTDKMFITVPFVIYGIFRYLYLVHKEKKGGNPTKLLINDIHIILTIVFWLTSTVIILLV